MHQRRFCLKVGLDTDILLTWKNRHSSRSTPAISVLRVLLCVSFYCGPACYHEKSQKICFRQVLVGSRKLWVANVEKSRFFWIIQIEFSRVPGELRRYYSVQRGFQIAAEPVLIRRTHADLRFDEFSEIFRPCWTTKSRQIMRFDNCSV